jgi:predicted ATPase
MHITVTGLAWWLDTSRQTLINYENSESNGWLKRCTQEDKREYIDTIKKAKRYIEMQYEDKLYDNKTTTGAIFTLKNNYAWCDKQEIVTTNADAKLSADEIGRQLEALGYNDK